MEATPGGGVGGAGGGARGDSRYNHLAYGMGLLAGDPPPDMYHSIGGGALAMGRAPPGAAPPMPRGAGVKRPGDASMYEQHHQQQQQQQHQQQMQGLDPCSVQEMHDDGGGGAYQPLQPKKSPPSNGKKTKGRVKIKMEYIDNKLRRYTTFSKRKTGIMKKAYELSTLTGTQVMLLVASETGHVYTFATRKLQPMITSDSGKRLIQTCLNSPDPPQGAGGAHGGDQRMSATGFEETELTYNIADEETKVRQLVYGGSPGGGGGGHMNQYGQPPPQQQQHMDHHHSMGMSPQGYHHQQQQQHGPCASPLPLPPALQYAQHPHMTHGHPQR